MNSLDLIFEIPGKTVPFASSRVLSVTTASVSAVANSVKLFSAATDTGSKTATAEEEVFDNVDEQQQYSAGEGDYSDRTKAKRQEVASSKRSNWPCFVSHEIRQTNRTTRVAGQQTKKDKHERWAAYPRFECTPWAQIKPHHQGSSVR